MTTTTHHHRTTTTEHRPDHEVIHHHGWLIEVWPAGRSFVARYRPEDLDPAAMGVPDEDCWHWTNPLPTRDATLIECGASIHEDAERMRAVSALEALGLPAYATPDDVLAALDRAEAPHGRTAPLAPIGLRATGPEPPTAGYL